MNKQKPKCKLCNDTGIINVKDSAEGRTLSITCECKKIYSYGNMTKTKEEHDKIIHDSIIKSLKSPKSKESKFVNRPCKNCLGSGYIYIRDTTETCKDCNGKGEIPKSSRQDFYDNVSSFITYPNVSLLELSHKFETETESIEDIQRLLGLLHLDNFALYIAKRDGIHPNSGVKWEYIGKERYNELVERNLDMISYLESVINFLKSK